VLWQRHTTAFTSSEFTIYSGKPGSRATVLRGHDIVVFRNRRNLQCLFSGCKHLRKSSHASFCPCLPLQLGAVPVLACRVLDIAVLTPFCSWGLCQTQPTDITVLMLSSHTFLIFHSPQLIWAILNYLASNTAVISSLLLFKYCINNCYSKASQSRL
jgi:hypothetical protein